MNTKETIKYLEKLVNFYPISSDQASVKRLLDYVAQELGKINVFKNIKLHQVNGKFSLTASTTGRKWSKVLLQGHVDVVPRPDELIFKISGDKIYGRGVFDMLFATASYLSFIKFQGDKLSNLDIGLMLTGDEELGGFDGVKYLLDEGYGGDVCILPDAGSQFGELNTSAKGIYNFRLTTYGKSHHGSRPWEGDGAANKLVHALHELLGYFDDSDQNNSTMTVAMLSAGDADNQGPNQAWAHIDIRYKDKADYTRIKDLVHNICNQNNAKVSHLLDGIDYKLDTDNHLVKHFIDMYKWHYGQDVTFTKAHGSSDARFFSAKDIPVLMLRPQGFGAHADEEWTSASELAKFDVLLADYLLDIAIP